MGTPGYRDQPPPPWDPTAPVDPAEAEEFLHMLHQEHPGLGPVDRRLQEVRREIAESGTYVQTTEELTFGARVAWRNSSRCIGRLYWRSLLVRDLREVRTPDGVFTELVRHLEIAVGDRGADGNRAEGTKRPAADSGAVVEPGARRIRPVISVFAPATPGPRPDTVLWNEQLIRYAGYRDRDGGIVGDPVYEEFTEAVSALGWRGKGDRFDVLPLVIESADGEPHLFELPEHAVVEVPLAHPEYPWFAELGLRWHAVPAISNMRLTIGGVSYPLAPFNGWYMGTEIGARNLADPDRFNQLPVVADRLGLDRSSESTLWRDRALVELNRAVLWSFERAGLRISDHHTESRRFLDHVAKEERAGRPTPADWTWIVPPMSSAATPVFHRYYHEADQRPNFYLDPEARELGRRGRVAPAAAQAPDAQATDAQAPTPQAPTPGQPATQEQPQRCPFTGAVHGATPVPQVRPAVPTGAERPRHAEDPRHFPARRRWPFRQRPPASSESGHHTGTRIR
jgi:nitric-oxide synthase